MAVERLARELFDVAYPGVDWNGHPGSHFIRLAHHVLRRERAAVRRARGRTLGYIVTNSEGHLFDEFLSKTEDGARAEREDQIEYGDMLLARVVAVPTPKRKVRRG